MLSVYRFVFGVHVVKKQVFGCWYGNLWDLFSNVPLHNMEMYFKYFPSFWYDVTASLNALLRTSQKFNRISKCCIMSHVATTNCFVSVFLTYVADIIYVLFSLSFRVAMVIFLSNVNYSFFQDSRSSPASSATVDPPVGEPSVRQSWFRLLFLSAPKQVSNQLEHLHTANRTLIAALTRAVYIIYIDKLYVSDSAVPEVRFIEQLISPH